LAITGLEYVVFSSLRSHGLLPARSHVLEFGESNWYGDVPVSQLDQDIQALMTDDRDSLLKELRGAVAVNGPQVLYEIARIFFRGIVDAASYAAIDPGSPTSRYQFDLNFPILLEDQFDVTINNGTAEHIFNVAQFFKTVHERTKPGGLMIHSSPFTGWPDHGFYNFQPTLFFDLARANQYEILSFVCGQIKPLKYVQITSHADFGKLLKGERIPPNAHLNVVYRKPSEPKEFAMPMQGYYAGTLTPEMKRMWHEHR
jgi:SAM-dependent methyltransferase